jgi:hypothetical protein
MRALLFLAALGAAILSGPSVRAQDANLGPTSNPPTASDPVTHHHKAYAKTTYGISCPGDRVVWVNTKSGVYHLEGERWFGRTKSGQYECEKAAKAEGDRETRNGQ